MNKQEMKNENNVVATMYKKNFIKVFTNFSI